ncbi:hypothetical protein GCM10022249_20490 [Enteractinococcus coprophilus]
MQIFVTFYALRLIDSWTNATSWGIILGCCTATVQSWTMGNGDVGAAYQLFYGRLSAQTMFTRTPNSLPIIGIR